MVGDRPLPPTVGEPGGQVVAETPEPEPRRSPRARISGRVLDEQGHPVPDATVRLADGGVKGGRDVRATTDRSGAFTLGGLRPGSTYWLVAEADDDRGALKTGRVRAKTSDTGVEISLGIPDDEASTAPSGARAGQPSRARPISDREEADGGATEEETSGVNREDLLPPAEEAEADPPASDAKRPRGGRPQLSPPEPAVGWRKSGDVPVSTRAARRDADLAGDDTANDSSPRPKPNASRGDGGAEDDGPNPLPPAIDSDRSAPVQAPDDGERAPARPRARRNVSSRDSPTEAGSGGLALAPGEEADPEPASPPAKKPPARRKRPAVEPGPPPMPSLEAAREPLAPAGEAIAAAEPSRLEPDAPLEPGPSLARQAPTPSPPAGSDPSALHDPPGPEASPAPAPVAMAVDPAQRPVFASQPTTPMPAPESESPRDYNPFALVAASQVALAATEAPARRPVSTPAPAPAPPSPPTPEPAIARTEAEPVAPAASPEASPPAPAPRKKWGEVAPASDRKKVVAEPARPTSIFARMRSASPATAVTATDASLALCDYDTNARRLVDFRLPDLEGNPVRFQDLDADYVLLDFWGTWCGPCLESIPHLIALQKQYGPGRLKVVGIACEKTAAEARKGKVDAFARKLGINYTVLVSTMDGSCPVQKALQIHYYPTMILVDRKGQVVWSAEGATPANLSRLDRTLASASRPEKARR